MAIVLFLNVVLACADLSAPLRPGKTRRIWGSARRELPACRRGRLYRLVSTRCLGPMSFPSLEDGDAGYLELAQDNGRGCQEVNKMTA